MWSFLSKRRRAQPTLLPPSQTSIVDPSESLRTIAQLTDSCVSITYEYLVAYGMLHGNLTKTRTLIVLSESTTRDAIPSRSNFIDRFGELSAAYAIEFDTTRHHVVVITMPPKTFIDLVALMQLFANGQKVFIDANMCVAVDAVPKLLEQIKLGVIKPILLKHYSSNYFKQAVKRNTIGLVTDCKSMNRCLRASVVAFILLLVFIVALPRSLFEDV